LAAPSPLSGQKVIAYGGDRLEPIGVLFLRRGEWVKIGFADGFEAVAVMVARD
jgi:hypothetical protein